MYCIKWGGIVHLDVLACFYCGSTINHGENINTFGWHVIEAHTHDHNLLMPYVFKMRFEKYPNSDSISLDAVLSLIVFSFFTSLRQHRTTLQINDKGHYGNIIRLAHESGHDHYIPCRDRSVRPIIHKSKQTTKNKAITINQRKGQLLCQLCEKK